MPDQKSWSISPASRSAAEEGHLCHGAAAGPAEGSRTRISSTTRSAAAIRWAAATSGPGCPPLACAPAQASSRVELRGVRAPSPRPPRVPSRLL